MNLWDTLSAASSQQSSNSKTSWQLAAIATTAVISLTAATFLLLHTVSRRAGHNRAAQRKNLQPKSTVNCKKSVNQVRNTAKTVEDFLVKNKNKDPKFIYKYNKANTMPNSLTTVENRSAQYLNNCKECYRYAIGKDPNQDEFTEVKKVVQEICPDWKCAVESDIQVKIVSGGITNRLYRLVWKEKSVLVRIYGENTEILIDREKENEIFASLSKNGLAPTYHGQFTNGRVEGWLNASPLGPDEIRKGAMVGYIGKEVAFLHRTQLEVVSPPLLWSIMQKLDQFARLALAIDFQNAAKRSKYLSLDLPSWKRKINCLKSVLSHQINEPSEPKKLDTLDTITRKAIQFANQVVFCHNDLLSGNILYNESWDRVRIIDYEYGGYNFRAFDIANHFCEYCGFEMNLSQYPNLSQQTAFLQAYISTASPALLTQCGVPLQQIFYKELHDIINKFALASHLFWGFWAVVQAEYSKIDFDFLGYADRRFKAFEQHQIAFGCLE